MALRCRQVHVDLNIAFGPLAPAQALAIYLVSGMPCVTQTTQRFHMAASRPIRRTGLDGSPVTATARTGTLPWIDWMRKQLRLQHSLNRLDQGISVLHGHDHDIILVAGPAFLPDHEVTCRVLVNRDCIDPLDYDQCFVRPAEIVRFRHYRPPCSVKALPRCISKAISPTTKVTVADALHTRGVGMLPKPVAGRALKESPIHSGRLDETWRHTYTAGVFTFEYTNDRRYM